MSFLSRKPARPDGRGRGDEHYGYDDYADDGYAQSDDDGWSPNEYFSPEGIKGKWAGENPAGRSGGRGGRDDSRENDFNAGAGTPGGFAGPGGYGADDATAMYDLPDGADEDRGDRRRSRRKDREDRGERTGILRLRRDRGEDIWPDDGISDEDYWASVAADRPLTGTEPPFDNVPAAGSGARPGMDARPGMGGTGSRFGGGQRGGDQRGGDRGAAGRLGAAPGLTSDYRPGGAPGSGAPGGPGQPGAGGRTGSGPMSARPGSGPLPARPVTGPLPTRPGTGPTATVGVTSSRPPANPATRPGTAKPGTGSRPQPALRPSFQPNGTTRPSGATGPGGGRPQDWGDRTERIERVSASGYPEPRPTIRGQGPSPAGGPGSPGGPGMPGAMPGSTGSPAGTTGRGREDSTAWRTLGRPQAAGRPPGSDNREASGPWPTATPATRGGAPARGDDDPLTSKSYSWQAMGDTDGRSYRAAARRSAAQAKLTEQAETFLSNQHQQAAQHRQGPGGEFWQYREDSRAPVPHSPSAAAPGGRYHAAEEQAQGRPEAGRPGWPGQPGRAASNPAGAALPGTGPGPAQPAPHFEPRPAQQRPPQRQPGPPQLPAAGRPAPAPNPPAPNPPAPNPPASPAPSGQNPYDSAVTGSYPYSGQPYPDPARPALDGPAPDDPYYRPPGTNGYPASGANNGRPGQGARYDTRYPAASDRRR